MPEPFHLKSGLAMPAVGIGTLGLGEDPAAAGAEIAGLRAAIERGIVLIDTAEAYGEGASETLVGRAIRGIPRERLFIVSKLHPWNAHREGIRRACYGTLARLGTDYLDLYLLNAPGRVAIQSALEGAEALKRAGRIRAFGVARTDAATLRGWGRAGLDTLIEVNQMPLNPARRGAEAALMPLMAERGIVAMGCTPLDRGRLAGHRRFSALAGDIGLDAAGLALAWQVSRRRSVPVAKATRLAHVDGLARAAARRLDGGVLEAIDAMLPPPAGR